MLVDVVIGEKRNGDSDEEGEWEWERGVFISEGRAFCGGRWICEAGRGMGTPFDGAPGGCMGKWKTEVEGEEVLEKEEGERWWWWVGWE